MATHDTRPKPFEPLEPLGPGEKDASAENTPACEPNDNSRTDLHASGKRLYEQNDWIGQVDQETACYQSGTRDESR